MVTRVLAALTALSPHAPPIQADWEAVGHRVQEGWFAFDARFGLALGALLLAFVVARALARRGRYLAVTALSEADRGRLRDAVTAAEARTDGELLVVVVEASDGHPDAPWKAAAAMLALGTLLGGDRLPWGAPLQFVLAQGALGGVGYLLARALTDFRRSFVRERRASEVAEEQALQEFQRLELASDVARHGVLLFVSLFEQRVVVLADEGAHAAVGEGAWVAIDEAVLTGIRGGSLCAGLERGIEAMGAVLAEKYPRTEDGPNRFRDEVEVRPR